MKKDTEEKRMKKDWIVTATLLMSMPFLGACGDTEELSEEDTAQAWEATNSTLMTANEMAKASGGGPEDESLGLAYTMKVPCLDGGSASFAGHLALDTFYGDFDWDVDYDACEVDGVVIDGNLQFTLDAERQIGEFNLIYTYRGELTYSGDVVGTCVVDMAGGASAMREVNMRSLDIGYSGTVCGHDASVTLSARSN